MRYTGRYGRRDNTARLTSRLVGIYVIGTLGAWVNGMVLLPAMGLRAPGLLTWLAVTAISCVAAIGIKLLQGGE